MNNQVIFDISQKGYDWFPVIIGLFFVLVGITGLKSNIIPQTGRASPKVAIIVGIIVSVGSFLFQFSNRQAYVTILRNGQASVVEGEIESFHPMPKEGHDSETFTVHGVSFAYSDFSVTPAFNNTSSHGGPLKGGMFVKVYYTTSREFSGEYAILRIERLPQ